MESINIYILGDSSTQFLHEELVMVFDEQNFKAVHYDAPFDSINTETINPASGLYQFKPDVT